MLIKFLGDLYIRFFKKFSPRMSNALPNGLFKRLIIFKSKFKKKFLNYPNKK